MLMVCSGCVRWVEHWVALGWVLGGSWIGVVWVLGRCCVCLGRVLCVVLSGSCLNIGGLGWVLGVSWVGLVWVLSGCSVAHG